MSQTILNKAAACRPRLFMLLSAGLMLGALALAPLAIHPSASRAKTLKTSKKEEQKKPALITLSKKNKKPRHKKQAKKSRKKRTQKLAKKIKNPAIDTTKTPAPTEHNINIFESTLFTNFEKQSPSFMWLYDQELYKKRTQIAGAYHMVLESWWKMHLESFYRTDRAANQIVIRPMVNAKFLTRFYPSLFARVEFELMTGSGSVQEIFKRVGEINGIRHREIFFLWTASRWLALQFGAINQKFLNAPLLMASNPFLSVVQNINMDSGENYDLLLKFQQAVPNTFSDSNSIYTQGISKTPLFATGSLIWNYHPKSFYTIKTYNTFFHFHHLPNDIANASSAYGNTPAAGDVAIFKYDYTGFYLSVEPLVQLLPNTGVQLKAHYIHNLMVKEQNLNKGLLYGIQIPIDLTENTRITPGFEYFTNQPDSSVAYYNSEWYGHNNRTGYAVEVTVNLYDHNIEIGMRYMNTHSLREQAVIQEQDYFLLFFRTNYAKI